MKNRFDKKEFKHGLKRGMPIAIGYIPVAFTFGLMAVSGGLPVWMAVFISLTNLTSAGQFAGTNLIIAGAGFLEITLTTFVINIRYMLMSLSLSQRIDKSMTLRERLIAAFGITDETFAVSSTEAGILTYSYLLGLILGPIVGWSTGTLLGALISSALAVSISSAMGIALYGMFIAIIIPPAKKSKPLAYVILLSVAIACILKYIPLFDFISAGFRVIIATILGACIGAVLFPIEETLKEDIIKEGEIL
jgi:predicted branched-subunit amino acid permease